MGARNRETADGLTKVRSGTAPLLRLLESGHFHRGSSRLLEGVDWEEQVDHGAHVNSLACAHSGCMQCWWTMHAVLVAGNSLACTHSGYAWPKGWQGHKIALVNLPLFCVRHSPSVVFGVPTCPRFSLFFLFFGKYRNMLQLPPSLPCQLSLQFHFSAFFSPFTQN